MSDRETKQITVYDDSGIKTEGVVDHSLGCQSSGYLNDLTILRSFALVLFFTDHYIGYMDKLLDYEPTSPSLLRLIHFRDVLCAYTGIGLFHEPLILYEEHKRNVMEKLINCRGRLH